MANSLKLYNVHSSSTKLTSVHYLVKHRCSKLLHIAVIVSLQWTFNRLN